MISADTYYELSFYMDRDNYPGPFCCLARLVFRDHMDVFRLRLKLCSDMLRFEIHGVPFRQADRVHQGVRANGGSVAAEFEMGAY
jgi:hypothetical protein